ncbi:hypothetical protein UY3_01519 [Chelonia mydas]|uniref:Uncharacterized protein n=1 Tax=Chelonia mydas TaxID=8469 RepID=M7C9H6_CHEMY|nr:hypothetical protein UY3_01519 [Chelonia mydas]
MFDFSESTRKDYASQQIAMELVVLEIYQTGDQCRERIKRLKTDCCKARDQNRISGNALSSCPFYKIFNRVLCTAPIMEQTVVRDDLVSKDGSPLTPESSM